MDDLERERTGRGRGDEKERGWAVGLKRLDAHTHTHNRPNQLTSSPVWFLKDISFCWAAHASRLTNSVCVTEGGRKGGGKADENVCG
jgi:hypothetical protein